MMTLIWIFGSISFFALLLATLVERGGIVGGVNGANGLIILVFLIVSFLASLVVAVIAGIFGGWGYLWSVLGGTVLYHGVMGAATIGYLQWLATRTARQLDALQALRDKQFKAWYDKRKV